MEICVFGAGAVGSYLAAKLIRTGKATVNVVARGAHLHAIRTNGIGVSAPEEDFRGKARIATDRPADLPPQDLVFVTLKAKDLPSAASAIASLTRADGRVIFVGNGVPWWWALGAEGDRACLPLLDPGGQLASSLGSRTIGCVVYSMNSLTAPGEVRHSGNNRWILGHPDGALTEPLPATAALLGEAGLRAECSADLRREVWIKLLKNLPLNPICALTRLSTDELATRPGLIALSQRLADEVVSLARAMGWDVSDCATAAVQAISAGGATPGGRAKGTRPSMLQDVLAGRRMEVAAIVGQLAEFAAEYAVPMPTLETILPLLDGLDASLAAGMGKDA